MRFVALFICAVSLNVGCARTNAPAKKGDAKPTAPVTAPQSTEPTAETAPEKTAETSPVTPTVADAATTNQSPTQSPTQAPAESSILDTARSASAGSLSVDQAPVEVPVDPKTASQSDPLAAGTLSAGTLSAGSLSAGSMTQAAPTDVQEVVVVASISAKSALAYVDRLKLPLVLPFAMPKHDVKDEVKSFVGIGCDKEIAASRKVKAANNLVAKLPKDLCFTNVLRQGKTTLVVVPKKLISRKTVITQIMGSVERRVEVVLRGDSSVAAFRETIVSKKNGSKTSETITRITMVNPKGTVLASEITPTSSTLTADAGSGAIVYEAKSVLGNGKVATAKKSLVVKDYENKGVSLTVNEDSPTTNPADITCNVIAVKKSNLETLVTKTIQGRCFHRN